MKNLSLICLAGLTFTAVFGTLLHFVYGFTGNIALKLTEGMSKFMLKSLKQIFTASITTKLSFLVMKKNIMSFRTRYDASTYGGAPILGISKPVIKAHGSSDAYAIKNAIRQAINCVDNSVTYKIAKQVVPDIIGSDN